MGFPKNKTFCPRPFLQYSSFNGNDFRLCCSADRPAKPISTKGVSVLELFNSDYMRKCRKKIYNGEPLQECKSCYELESHGGFSDRLDSIDSFEGHAAVIENIASNYFQVEAPIVLDLRVGNVCNLRCQSCFPNLSVGVYDEIRDAFSKHGDLRSQPEHTRKLSAGFSFAQLEEALPYTQEIKIIGGEPSLSKEWSGLAKKLINTKLAKNIDLSIHTNLTKWNDEFFNSLTEFKSVGIGLSIDAYGSLNEYLRYPSQWSEVSHNLKMALELFSRSETIHPRISTVVQISNLYQLSELGQFLIDDTMALEAAEWVPIPLTDPEYYDPYILPPSISKEAKRRFEEWREIISIAGKNWTKKMSNCLSSYANSRADQELINKYFQVTKIYDQYRQQNIADYSKSFRELSDQSRGTR